MRKKFVGQVKININKDINSKKNHMKYIRSIVKGITITSFITGIIGLIIGIIIGYFVFVTPPPAEAISTKEINMRVFQFGYDPSIINVTEGTKVIIHITEVTANLEPGFAVHTFTIGPPYNINVNLEVKKKYTIEFVASYVGEFIFECAVYCGSQHAAMKGKLIVNIIRWTYSKSMDCKSWF